ncbi:MAG TPA: ABC transporter permease [Cyclobacteriaceae bacterium]|nr:ABC transporter permease [Cyclobacteriaceae bacterium]HMV09467.1 ABC transporter permease [Cyclobacteriaceae bacterium]HMV89446.1 ABC transporter permease [Cyclobacteriaceae bacterium]HMX02488.1 ABC transporter permease [Cyclobacteriaceae bacterium]HMX52082.1 ABC transporter permease [Cyclobacteriaceae bacterium]
MLKNHLLILFRNLNKNRLFVFINIAGLAIAIGCCVVGYFNFDFNNSFDEVHTNAASIYRVNAVREYQGASTSYGLVPLPLGEMVRQNVKDVEMFTRVSGGGMNIRIGDEMFGTNCAYIDQDFFKMFSFEFIHGSAAAMTDKSKIVISDQLATRYFGNENPIGKAVTNLVHGDVKKEYEIVGVYKLAKRNSSFDEDLFALYDNYWDVSPEFENGANWKTRNALFVYVSDPSRVAAIEKQLQPYTENNNKVREDFIIREFKLDQLKGMAVRDEVSHRPGVITRHASPLSAVIGCAVMGVIMLLIACFNLTNTSIALSSKRLKEIGIRKVMGSMRKQLIAQYIGETLVICFIALLLGIVLADSFLLPAFNKLWPYMKLEAQYLEKPEFLIVMLGVLVFAGIVAGSYPAFYVSKFHPAAVLKGQQRFGGNGIATYVFLGAQLVLSLSAIVCSAGFVANARFQREFDMGYNQNGVIFTFVDNRSEYETYRNALAGNPEIKSISGSLNHIYSSYYNDPVKHESRELEANIMDVGDDYMKTVGMTLLEGRDFIKDSETDRKESVIVTQELVRKFGWDKPIGKEIIWMDTVKLYVIGVARDIYSIWEPLEPMILRYSDPERVNYAIVSTSPDNVQEVNAFMEKKWKEVFPNRMYNSRFMNAGAVEADQVNKNILWMFLFEGGVALLLSVTGLFTLVSLNIIKRMKEIGVRKVLGASVANLSRIINSQFIVLLMIALVIGSYFGMWISDILMGSIFDHYQPPTIITAVVSCVMLIIACVLTVAFKTYNTARMNPSDVLRSE